MDAKSIKAAARNAVDRTRSHYGPKVWDYVNRETRRGWVSHSIVMDFASFAPETTAAEVAEVVKVAHEIIMRETV